MAVRVAVTVDVADDRDRGAELGVGVAARLVEAQRAAAVTAEHDQRGAGVALAGVVEFHRAGTTVNPVRTAAVRRVVTGGIYRVRRNPMYLGFALALTGWALWLANALALLGVPLLVAYLSRYQIAPEERLMRDRFGAEYEAYLAQVRRWIGRR